MVQYRAADLPFPAAIWRLFPVKLRSSSCFIHEARNDIVDYCGIWLDTVLFDIPTTRVNGKATTVFHKKDYGQKHTARRIVIHLHTLVYSIKSLSLLPENYLLPGFLQITICHHSRSRVIRALGS